MRNLLSLERTKTRLRYENRGNILLILRHLKSNSIFVLQFFSIKNPPAQYILSGLVPSHPSGIENHYFFHQLKKGTLGGAGQVGEQDRGYSITTWTKRSSRQVPVGGQQKVHAWSRKQGVGKGGLISEGILTLAPFPTKGAKSSEQKILISCLL